MISYNDIKELPECLCCGSFHKGRWVEVSVLQRELKEVLDRLDAGIEANPPWVLGFELVKNGLEQRFKVLLEFPFSAKEGKKEETR